MPFKKTRSKKKPLIKKTLQPLSSSTSKSSIKERKKEKGELPTVLFQVLTQGSIRGELALLMAMLAKRGFPISVHWGRNGYMASDRNSGIEEFYNNTNCDYLIQCDADMVAPADVLRLAWHGKDLVGAVCLYIGDVGPTLAAKGLDTSLCPACKDSKEHRPTCTLCATTGLAQPFPRLEGEPPLKEIEWTGTGCYAISRKLVRTFKEKEGCVFKYDFNNETGELGSGCDVHMSRRAKKLGFKVYLDRTIICGHNKAGTWTPTRYGELTHQKWGTLWRSDLVPQTAAERLPITEVLRDPPNTCYSDHVLPTPMWEEKFGKKKKGK